MAYKWIVTYGIGANRKQEVYSTVEEAFAGRAKALNSLGYNRRVSMYRIQEEDEEHDILRRATEAFDASDPFDSE